MLTPLHESDPRVTPRVGYSPVYRAFTTEKNKNTTLLSILATNV